MEDLLQNALALQHLNLIDSSQQANLKRLIEKFPEDMRDCCRPYTSKDQIDDLYVSGSVDALVLLHYNTKMAILDLARTEAHFAQSVQKALFFEQIKH